jgi:ribonuclease P protein component
MKLATLKSRPQFMAVRGGGRWSGPAFVLEGRRRLSAGECDGPRFGFTVTRKMGIAVQRNRMRRRLREAVRATMSEHADAGYDYVVIAREAALDRPFAALLADFVQAYRRVHTGRSEGKPRSRNTGLRGR